MRTTLVAPLARWSAVAFLVVAACLVVTVWQSSRHLAPGEAGLGTRATLQHGDDVLGPWLWWDGGVYESIADRGYPRSDVDEFRRGQQARVAFFPGYPLVVRAASAAVGDTALALVMVTFLAGLLLSIALARWMRKMIAGRAAQWGILALLVFPWSFFLVGAGYSDALFVLCAVVAFLLLEDDRPISAGIVGALASLTRPTGIAVVIGLMVRAAERGGALRFDGWRPRLATDRLCARDLGVLLSMAGIGSYAAFCWARYGDPLAFATALRGWNGGSGPRIWLKVPFFTMVQHSSDTFYVLRLLIQGLVMLVFCAAIPAVWRRFGSGYGVYVAVVLLMPAIGAAAFQSNGRHVLAAFPVFALLGEHLDRTSVVKARGYLGASGLVLLGITSFWARGYWMG